MSRASVMRPTQERKSLWCGLILTSDRPHQGSYLRTSKFPAENGRATVWKIGRGDTVA